jgi:hypothetical protein
MGHKSNLSIPESDFGFTPGFDAYFDVSLHYLHMPLNFRFSFPVGEDFKLQIMAGPYLSYFLKGRDKVQISGYSKGVTIYHVDESREMKPGKNPLDNNDKIEYVNPLDLGLNGSLSLVMSNKFTLGLNYLFGISNILPFYKEEPTGYNRSDSQKYRNSVFSIRFGYSILNPDK